MFHCRVVELSYFIYFCKYCELDASCAIHLWYRVPLYHLNNTHFRSKHHKISLTWLRFLFTLFKLFICSYITKPTTPNSANFTHNKLHNFPLKFDMNWIESDVICSCKFCNTVNPLTPVPPVTSLGLSSNSDVITFDQNWHHLYSTSVGGKDLSNDA